MNVYIDGFNLFHAIKVFGKKYYWLDYKKLAEHFIDKDLETIGNVYYFTAYYPLDKDGVIRHKIYVSALNKKGIHTIKGKYQTIQKKFINTGERIVKRSCGVDKNKIKNFSISEDISKMDILDCIDVISYRTLEEKRTDVNMAIQIVSDGILDKYDKAIVITGDSDISPAIKQIQKMKKKKFLVVLPVGKRGVAMKTASDECGLMTEKHLKKSLLDDNVFGINKPKERY